MKIDSEIREKEFLIFLSTDCFVLIRGLNLKKISHDHFQVRMYEGNLYRNGKFFHYFNPRKNKNKIIVDQAGLPGPLSIFIYKVTYLFDFLKWILLRIRMLNDHCKYNSL